MDETHIRPGKLWVTWQKILTGIAVAIAFLGTFAAYHLNAPGAPVALYWTAEASLLVAALVLSPPVYFRLSHNLRKGAFFGSIVAFFVLMAAIGQVQDAYDQTPEGAKAKAASDQQMAVMASEAAKESEAAAELQRNQQAAADTQSALDRTKACLSWGGRLSSLEEEVKGRLHNPGAFEHVSTRIIGPTPDGDNIEMTFRAENGFSALREGWVRAKVNPNNCELESVGRLNDS